MLMTLGAVVGIAPAALAHGDHGAAPAAIFEPTGPYVVSVWVEVFGDETVTGHAVIESAEDAGAPAAPTVWVETGQGTRIAANVENAQEGVWTVQFQSMAGASLIVEWPTPNGPERADFALRELPAPWWFKVLLVLMTPPGLWFGFWLAKRRRRAFGLAPTAWSTG